MSNRIEIIVGFFIHLLQLFPDRWGRFRSRHLQEAGAHQIPHDYRQEINLSSIIVIPGQYTC